MTSGFPPEFIRWKMAAFEVFTIILLSETFVNLYNL